LQTKTQQKRGRPVTFKGKSSAISLFEPPVGGLIGRRVGLDTFGAT